MSQQSAGWKTAVINEADGRIDATNYGAGTAGQSVGFDNTAKRGTGALVRQICRTASLIQPSCLRRRRLFGGRGYQNLVRSESEAFVMG